MNSSFLVRFALMVVGFIIFFALATIVLLPIVHPAIQQFYYRTNKEVTALG